MPRLDSKTGKEWALVEIRPAGLRIAADQNVIIGSRNIMKYTGIGSLKQLHSWVAKNGFPAILRPDGLWMTTVTAVDEWIYLCLMTQNAEEYAKSHMLSTRAQKVAKHVGILPADHDVGDYNKTRNSYKRDWEKRTGKNPQFYTAIKDDQEDGNNRDRQENKTSDDDS